MAKFTEKENLNVPSVSLQGKKYCEKNVVLTLLLFRHEFESGI